MAAACLVRDLPPRKLEALDRFARDIGLAFQIRDDILDVTGATEVIGKPAGADQKLSKATWPATFGLEEAHRRCDELLCSGIAELSVFGARAAALESLAIYIVARKT